MRDLFADPPPPMASESAPLDADMILRSYRPPFSQCVNTERINLAADKHILHRTSFHIAFEKWNYFRADPHRAPESAKCCRVLRLQRVP